MIATVVLGAFALGVAIGGLLVAIVLVDGAAVHL